MCIYLYVYMSTCVYVYMYMSGLCGQIYGVYVCAFLFVRALLHVEIHCANDMQDL